MKIAFMVNAFFRLLEPGFGRGFFPMRMGLQVMLSRLVRRLVAADVDKLCRRCFKFFVATLSRGFTTIRIEFGMVLACSDQPDRC